MRITHIVFAESCKACSGKPGIWWGFAAHIGTCFHRHACSATVDIPHTSFEPAPLLNTECPDMVMPYVISV